MKTINVVAAVIHKDGKVLATQRGYGPYKDGWEFPGGKVEKNESPEEAVVREIKEELNVTIAVEKYIGTIEWDYPEFHLSMGCYLSHVIEGELQLLEHEAAKWLAADELDSVAWLPADLDFVKTTVAPLMNTLDVR